MGRKATPAQLAALAKGRRVLAAKRKRGLARRGPAKRKRGAGIWDDIKGAGRSLWKEVKKEGKKKLLEVAKKKLGGGVRRRPGVVRRRKRAGGTAVGGGVMKVKAMPRKEKWVTTTVAEPETWVKGRGWVRTRDLPRKHYKVKAKPRKAVPANRKKLLAQIVARGKKKAGGVRKRARKKVVRRKRIY